MGAEFYGVMPALVQTLQTGAPAARLQAVSTIGGMGVAASAAFPEMIGVLKGEDEELRLRVIVTLGGLGTLAEDAAPALVDLLKDKNPEIAQAARAALIKIQPAVPWDQDSSGGR